MAKRTAEEEARRAAIQEAKQRVRGSEAEYRSRVRGAAEQLSRVKLAREKALDEARRQLKSAESARESRVSAAEREAESARTGQLLARLGRLSLYENRLETPDGTVPLSTDIRVTAEVSGQKTKDSDNREVLVLLDTPKFDSVVRCDPGQAVGAREFAAKVNTAAKNAEERLDAYKQRLDLTTSALESVRSDRADIEAASARVTALEADTSEVDRAEAVLAEANADTAVLVSHQQALLELDPTASAKPVKPPRVGLVGSRPALWWRDRSRWAKRGYVAAAAVVSLVVLLIVIGVLVGQKKATDTSAIEKNTTAATPSTNAPPPPPPPPVKKHVSLALALAQPKASRARTYLAKFTVKGYATAGSRVQVNGQAAARSGTRFVLTVPLRMGQNTLRITSSKKGFKTTSKTVALIRRLQPLDLVLLAPASSQATVHQSTFTIRGRTTPGSTVQIGGSAVTVTGNRFESTVQLSQGKNVFSVRADKQGFASRYTRFTVVRNLSPEEVRQAFINAATTIPYSQLNKNADAYAETRVKYYGKILQIQEDYTGGFMLLSVTDLGYDIWNDNIWVNYTGHVRGAEGDKLTVYGVVVGSKSYDTQAGGTTYVPEVDAKYVVE